MEHFLGYFYKETKDFVTTQNKRGSIGPLPQSIEQRSAVRQVMASTDMGLCRCHGKLYSSPSLCTLAKKAKISL